MQWGEFDKWVGALCAWREARGEGRDGIRAVLHVIHNRSKAQGKAWAEIVFAPLQFSSMTYVHDTQLTTVPRFPDPQFTDCFELADAVYQDKDFDITNGATHYYAKTMAQPPVWAKAMQPTAQIGNHLFFKVRGARET